MTGSSKPVKQVGFGSAYMPKQPTNSTRRPNSRGSISKTSQTGEGTVSQDGGNEKNILEIKHSESGRGHCLDRRSGEAMPLLPSNVAAAHLKQQDKMRRRYFTALHPLLILRLKRYSFCGDTLQGLDFITASPCCI